MMGDPGEGREASLPRFTKNNMLASKSKQEENTKPISLGKSFWPKFHYLMVSPIQ